MGAVASKSVVFDLNTAAGRKLLNDAYGGHGDMDETDIKDFVSLTEYLKSGEEPRVRFGRSLIFYLHDEDAVAMVKGGIVYKLDTNGDHSGLRSALQDLADEGHSLTSQVKSPAVKCDVLGVILDRKIEIPSGTYKKTVIRNGDEDRNVLVNELPSGFPTMSFSCMGQMFKDDDFQETVHFVAKQIATHGLALVDFIPDEIVAATQAEQDQYKKTLKDTKAPMPKNRPGFTMVGGREWHRSATIVLRRSSDNTSYIFGQDEDTYFGCKLADNPKTVNEAFTSLIPPAARGKAFQRQGEWFMLPVAKKDVPALADAIAILPDSCGLPITDPDSNLHQLDFHGEDAMARVGKDGIIYACDGGLRHNDHADVTWHGWVALHRNTALKSVSADANVD